jgi:hypothetical protein
MPRFRRVWIAVVVSFHVLNWFTLNLFFWHNALLVLLVVSDTEAWVSRALAWRGASARVTRRQPVVNTARSATTETARTIE